MEFFLNLWSPAESEGLFVRLKPCPCYKARIGLGILSLVGPEILRGRDRRIRG